MAETSTRARRESGDLSALLLPELRKIATNLGIEGAAELKKPDLVTAITDLQAANREAAKALTGYKVDKSSGKVIFYPKQHFSGSIRVLGTQGSFDASSLSDFLVARSDCALFITERIWYRFISSMNPLADTTLTSSFASRDIAALVKAIGRHSALDNPDNSMVKSPIDWFVDLSYLYVHPSTTKQP